MRRSLSRYAGALALAAGCEANDALTLGVSPGYQRPDAAVEEGGDAARPILADPTGELPAAQACVTQDGRKWKAEPLVTLDELGCGWDCIGRSSPPRLSVDTDGSLWLFEATDASSSTALHVGPDGELLGLVQSDGSRERVAARALSNGRLYTYEFQSSSKVDDVPLLNAYDGALELVAGPFSAPDVDADYATSPRWDRSESVHLAADPEGVLLLRFRAFTADFTLYDPELRVLDAWSAELSGYPVAFDASSVLNRTPEGALPSAVSLDGVSVGRYLTYAVSLKRSSVVQYDVPAFTRDAEGNAIVSAMLAREDPDYPAPDSTRCDTQSSDCAQDPWLWVARFGEPSYVWYVHAFPGTVPAVHADGRVLVPSFSTSQDGVTHLLAEISADGAECTRSALPIGVRTVAIAPDGTVYYVSADGIGRLVEAAP